MKIIAHNRVLEIEAKDSILTGLETADLNKLVEDFFAAADAAQNGAPGDLSASGETEPREITGEEILTFTLAAGGKADYTVDPETGLIDSISASGGETIFEYDPAEMTEVLESLQAAGSPTKIVGDLAQTSISAEASFTGNTTSGSPTIAAPSSVADLSAGDAISGAGIPANTKITDVTPAVNLAPTGNTTSGSPNVAAVSSTVGLAIGQSITGAGIPGGTTIAAVGSGTLTLSANASATASGVSLAVTAPASVTLSANATATASGVAFATTGQMQVLALAEWTLDWKRKTVDATTTDDATYESSLGSTASWSVKAKYMFLVGDESQSDAVVSAIQSPQNPQLWNFFPDVNIGHPAYSGYAYVDGITIASGSGKLVSLDTSLKGTGKLTVGSQLAPIAQPNTVTGKQAVV